MTPRARALLALGLAAVACPAAAFDVSGTIGAGTSRSDTWDSAAARGGAGSLDWNANVGFANLPVNPLILVLVGGVGYGAHRTMYEPNPSRSGTLSYQANALIGTAWGLPAAVGASHTTSDFTTSNTGGTGTTVTQSESLILTRQDTKAPTLQGLINRTDSTNRSFLAPEVRSGSTNAMVMVAQSLDVLQYGGSYSTTWSDGAFAETNYRLHDLSFGASAAPAKGITVNLSDHYALRVPTVDAPFNPRYDQQAFSTGVTWSGTERVNVSSGYTYAHSVVTAPGAPSQETLAQGVSAGSTYRYTRDLSFNASAAGTFGFARSATEEQRISGQNVGLGVSWSHDGPVHSVQLGGGGNVGAVEPTATDVQLAYGFNGLAAYKRPLGRWTGSVGYNVSYGSGLGGLTGSSFGQGLSATTTGRLGGVGTSASVSASSSRSDNGVLGTTFSRSLSASASASRGSLSSNLNAGISQGLSDALRSSATADGLFLSPAYNTNSRFVTLQLTHRTVFNLSLSALGRYSESTSPGRLRQWERGGSLQLMYPFGQLQFQVSDSISQGGIGGSWTTGNTVFVTVSRGFGAKF